MILLLDNQANFEVNYEKTNPNKNSQLAARYFKLAAVGGKNSAEKIRRCRKAPRAVSERSAALIF